MIQEPPAVHNTEMFVKPNSQLRKFECTICTNPQKNPVLCREGHGYCRSCIEQWKERSEGCPSCEALLDVLVRNRTMEDLMAESLVYCFTRLPDLLACEGGGAAAGNHHSDNTDAGQSASVSCDDSSVVGLKRKIESGAAAKDGKARIDRCMWTGKLQDADSHFRKCDYAGVVCCFVGCGTVMPRMNKVQHEAGCDYRTFKCKWDGCDVKARGAELDPHQLDCPKREVMCPNAGCGITRMVDTMTAHRTKCGFEQVPCSFASVGCSTRVLRKDISSHEDAAMAKHNRLLLKKVSELQQAHESLKHHVMPADEIIVFRVRHDELTGKVPFVPRFDSDPTIPFSESRKVRGYEVHLLVETNDTRREYQDHCGVYLEVDGGPFPCKVKLQSFELVHHDGLPASAVKNTVKKTLNGHEGLGIAKFISKARLASPDNNPYVKDGYVTFTCTFRFV